MDVILKASDAPSRRDRHVCERFARQPLGRHACLEDHPGAQDHSIPVSSISVNARDDRITLRSGD